MGSDMRIQVQESEWVEYRQEVERLARELARVKGEAERAKAQLRSVYDISEVLGASLNEEQTFSTLVEKLGVALQAEHCSLWLRDAGSMHIVAGHDSRPEALDPRPVSVVQPGHPLNVVFDTATPGIWVRQAQAPEPDAESLMSDLRVNSLLLVPLQVQDIPIGVVALGRLTVDDPFDITEVTLVESVINQAATALQNAGLYEEIRALNRSLEARVESRTQELAREKKRIETLYAIGQELSTSLDLDQVLDKTLRLVSDAVGAKYGSIMLLDRTTDTLVYRARLGGRHPLPPDGKDTPFRPGIGVAGWVLEQRKPVLIDDVLLDERWIAFPEKETLTRSLIAAPLMVGDDIHGVLLIADGKPGVFNQDQFRLIIASAQQVAQTISNVQLYSYVLQSAERLGRLLRTEQEERSKSQAILRSIADGVIVNDTRHRVIVCNRAAVDMLGVPAEDVLGQDVRTLFDAFDEDGRQEALQAQESLQAQEMLGSSPSALSGQVIETTLEGQNKIISARIAPVLTETGEWLGIVTALRDITPEVEADRAKSEFVSTVSHELRTPLTSIKGYTDLLYARAVGPVNEGQERFLAIIKSNADRLTALINDLLDISRIEAGRVGLKIELVDLVEVIHEVTDSIRGQIAAKQLRLDLELPASPAEIMGDRSRLIQIVTNLLSNAIKYTDQGWISVSLTSLGEIARLDIADSGIGIATEDQSRIFERFYRADTPVMEGRGGTGLGLAITKQLVELHGGRVWVKSEPGVGSTFTIILPAVAQDEPLDVPMELSGDAKKILVVDDDRDLVALLRHQLATEGYQVITAATGDQAVAKAVAQQPDLITLDLLLPDRHGFDVLRELKTRPEAKHIPVIVMSVVRDTVGVYNMGAVDCIVKPVSAQQLLDSVARVLALPGDC